MILKLEQQREADRGGGRREGAEAREGGRRHVAMAEGTGARVGAGTGGASAWTSHEPAAGIFQTGRRPRPLSRASTHGGVEYRGREEEGKGGVGAQRQQQTTAAQPRLVLRSERGARGSERGAVELRGGTAAQWATEDRAAADRAAPRAAAEQRLAEQPATEVRRAVLEVIPELMSESDPQVRQRQRQHREEVYRSVQQTEPMRTTHTTTRVQEPQVLSVDQLQQQGDESMGEEEETQLGARQ
jgi:hypothetical protein